MDGTGSYGDGAYGQGDPRGQAAPGASGGWQPGAQGQQPQQGPPGPGASGGWQQPAQNGWPQQPQQQGQAPNQWAQQQQAQNAWPQQQNPQNPWGWQNQPQRTASPYTPQAPNAYAPQFQAPQVQAPPQAPREGLTPNPFALPGQNAYASWETTQQGQQGQQGQQWQQGQPGQQNQPVNPYAPIPLGTNAAAKRDDQTWLQRTGLSKGRAAWLAVLIVVAGGFWTWDKFFSSTPANAKVGDCVHTGATAYDVKKVSCSDPSADASVIAKFDGTSDDHKCDQYATGDTQVMAFVQLGKDHYVLCLKPLDAPGGSAPTTAG